MSDFMISSMFDSDNAVMTSLDIEAVTGSRHDTVKRTISRLVARGVISQPPMADGVKSANGVVVQVYVFKGDKAKRDSLIVVAQLSPEFTADIVDRWIYLEKQNKSLTRELEYWQLKERDDKAIGSFHGTGLAYRKTTKRVNNEAIVETLNKMQLTLNYGGEK